MVKLLHADMHTSTNNRALAWPRLSRNLTFLPRLHQHGSGPKAACKAWIHPFSTQTPDSEEPHFHVQPRDNGET